MTTPVPIVAGILIGGKSRRMGVDKAALPWRETTVLETIVGVARSVTRDVVLLGKCDSMPDGLDALPRLPDPYEDIGPIAGLAALLSAFPDRWCLLLSCDVPNITAGAIQTLLAGVSPDVRVLAYTTPDSGGGTSLVVQSTAAFYHASILGDVQRAVAAKRYALNGLVRSLPHKLIPADEHTGRALVNINTPDDYETHRRG